MSQLGISFVVPMYNAEKYIGRCIESILRQGLDRGSFEIILVNDGSRDGTARIADSYVEKFTFVRVIHQYNQGLSVARNVGFAAANGDYVWFIDVDDYALDGAANVLLRTAQEQRLDVLTFRVKHVDPSPVDAAGFIPTATVGEVMDGHDYVASHNYNNGAWLYLVRRAYLLGLHIQFEPGRYCEDGMFTLALLSGAKRVSHYPSEAYAYVRSPGGITKLKTAAHYHKVAADFFFAAEFFDKYLERESASQTLPKGYKKRVLSRRDSYVFFLSVRLVRSDLPVWQIMRQHREMRKRGWIPLIHLSRDEYPGLKYTLMLFVIQLAPVYLLAILMSRAARFISRNTAP